MYERVREKGKPGGEGVLYSRRMLPSSETVASLVEKADVAILDAAERGGCS